MKKAVPAAIWIKKLGDCWFAVALNDEGGLVCSTFSKRSESDVRAAVDQGIRQCDRMQSQPNPEADQLIAALYEMYQGRPARIGVELDMRFVSPFHKVVYHKTRQIPHGKVATYGRIAESLGSMKLSRAVGHANAANPFVLIVPCHRVVPWTLEVGNYGRGSEVKRELLKREGVRFEGQRISGLSVWMPSGRT
jgi:O-6-methylguanine DNA methyltransferase